MVLLGDVTGKGVTAASLTSLVRYTREGRGGATTRGRRGARAGQPRAARAPAARAGDDGLRGCCGDGELTLAVGGHPLPLLKPAAAARRSRSARPGMLLGAVHDYAGAQEVTVAGRARRHAAALHGRRHRHAGRGRALRRGAPDGGRGRRAARPGDAAARRLAPRSTRSPAAPRSTTGRCSRCSAPYGWPDRSPLRTTPTPAASPLVTGGGTGIGRATALELAGSGAAVVVCGRRRGAAASASRAIEAGGRRVRSRPRRPARAGRRRARRRRRAGALRHARRARQQRRRAVQRPGRGDRRQGLARGRARLTVDAVWERHAHGGDAGDDPGRAAG